MKKAEHFRFSAIASAALAAVLSCAAALSGCDVDSSNTSHVVSNSSGTSYNFSGLYRPTGDGVEYLVYPSEEQSGTKLTWMRIVQDGSGLQGYDNAGQNWSGAISTVDDAVAHFSLEGATTAGNGVTIAGTMTYASEKSTISASWLESGGFSGNFFAEAVVAPPATPTNPPSGSLSITPNSATIAMNEARTFTASGGNGTYTWSHSGTCGSLSSASGTNVVYSHVESGSDVLTVRSGSETASATITCE